MFVLLVILLVVAVLISLGVWAAHHVSLAMLFPRFPANYQLSEEYFQLTAHDGVKLAARYWPNPTAKYTVLFLHGNGEDLGTISEYLPLYQKEGFAVMAVDYRGYGHSGGRSTEFSAYADAEHALSWLKSEHQTPTKQVIIIGFSLGGGPATEMAVRHSLAALILICPFASAYRVKTRWPIVPGDKFQNTSKAARIKCPLLLVHGLDDRTVPVWHGKMIFAAAREPKTLLLIEGGHHSDVVEVAGERYWKAVRAFTASLSS